MKCWEAATFRSAASMPALRAWYCGLRSSKGTFMVEALGSGSVRAARAAVGVLDAHDVVLTEVAARLHLDDLQDLGAGVLDPVHCADRYVGRFVLAEVEDLVVARDAGAALDDDPVLGAMRVLLQGQLRARLDREALNLEPGAGIDAVVAAPGAEHLAVQAWFAATRLLHAVDELLHVLDARLGRDHDGILRLDHHVPFETDHGDQAIGRIQQAVLRVLREDVAARDIAARIRRQDRKSVV